MRQVIALVAAGTFATALVAQEGTDTPPPTSEIEKIEALLSLAWQTCKADQVQGCFYMEDFGSFFLGLLQAGAACDATGTAATCDIYAAATMRLEAEFARQNARLSNGIPVAGDIPGHPLGDSRDERLQHLAAVRAGTLPPTYPERDDAVTDD